MISEQEVLDGIDKPRTEAALKIRLDPGVAGADYRLTQQGVRRAVAERLLSEPV